MVTISVSCCESKRNFDREVWLRHSDSGNLSNARSFMVDDLMKNYLNPGLDRDSITSLLGKPQIDRVEPRLPEGLVVPDSVSFQSDSSSNPGYSERWTQRVNQYFADHSQPDTLMLYFIGWSTLDHNYLVVKLDSDSTAYDYWIEQH